VKLPVDDPALSLVGKTGIATFDVVMASPYDAGKYYGIGAGVSGTSPGLPLAPGLTLPLNWDAITAFCLLNGGSIFNDPVGVLDPRGQGSLKVRGPEDPALRGVTVHFAGTTFTLEGFRAVSKALNVKL